MKKKVAVLGATGSIGKSTLEILRSERLRFEPVLFTAGKNYDELQKLKKEFPGVMIALAQDQMQAIAGVKADITVNGISGATGLEPSAAVLKSGSDLALANKETLVMAGQIIFELAGKNKTRIIPVDSEHSAIFKLIEAHGKENLSEIILTASGGPFKNFSKEELGRIKPEQALAHPTWNMGPKITVDSATMANKGLEVIEAAFLFGLPSEKIRVAIHPQSMVHSMIRLKDGAVYAQISKPDMKLPIYNALTWPQTVNSPFTADFAAFGADFDFITLSFEKPDFEKFPMLGLAYEALKGAPRLPVIYNAANEIAVQAFFEGRIGFLEISRVVGYVLSRSLTDGKEELFSIETVLSLDRKARELAEEFINLGVNDANI